MGERFVKAIRNILATQFAFKFELKIFSAELFRKKISFFRIKIQIKRERCETVMFLGAKKCSCQSNFMHNYEHVYLNYKYMESTSKICWRRQEVTSAFSPLGKCRILIEICDFCSWLFFNSFRHFLLMFNIQIMRRTF